MTLLPHSPLHGTSFRAVSGPLETQVLGDSSGVPATLAVLPADHARLSGTLPGEA